MNVLTESPAEVRVQPAPVEFDDWYREAFPRLVTAISVSTGDLEVAREATAEACVRALERWKRVSRMENPSGWVYTVACNLIRRRGRRFNLEQRYFRKETAPPVLEPSADAIAVRDAVRALPDRARAAVVLRYFVGLTEVEVAERLGVSRGTVSASLHAARRRLASTLGSDMEVHDA